MRGKKPNNARKLALAIAGKIQDVSKKLNRSFSIMEVCGTHTMSVSKNGLRKLLPDNIRLLSGPGCPVCVTTPGDIDKVLCLAGEKDVIIATFGDMLKVRGSSESLQSCRLSGADVRIVYSPLDALALAQQNPDKNIVFIGVGFETTAPAIAAAVREAAAAKVANFFVFPLLKLVPPALRYLLASGKCAADGFMLPGHVSAIIGLKPYGFIVKEFKKPCAVAGFEPVEILRAIHVVLEMAAAQCLSVANEYSWVVRPRGNPAALAITRSVFELDDARWRGIGALPASGLKFRKNFSRFDAGAVFNTPATEKPEPKHCLCGEIIMGRRQPSDCRLFGTVCTPHNAVGPCMVSSEGACAAWYYHGK